MLLKTLEGFVPDSFAFTNVYEKALQNTTIDPGAKKTKE